MGAVPAAASGTRWSRRSRCGAPRGQPGAERARERLPPGEIEPEGLERLPLPQAEFARVLGRRCGARFAHPGRRGSGDRQVRTLLLQVAARWRRPTGPVLYVSGEESARQIKMRATADHPERQPVRGHGDQPGGDPGHTPINEPRALIVDSVQTVTSDELTLMAGSISQVREAAARFQRWAKASGSGRLPGRARDQGGRHRRARRCWSTSWTRCSTWKATASTPTGCCARQEPLRRDLRGRRVRDAGARGWSRCPTPPRRSWPSGW